MMSVTIRDCFNVPSLRAGVLVSGERGLDRSVRSVSVLEWIDVNYIQNHFFVQNEIVITSFYSMRNQVDQQLKALKKMADSGEVAMILYYVGEVLPDIDASLLRLSDELAFPILMMPPHQLNFRYSDALMEISKLILEKGRNSQELPDEILAQMKTVPAQYHNTGTILHLLSDYLKISILICSSSGSTLMQSICSVDYGYDLKEYVFTSGFAQKGKLVSDISRQVLQRELVIGGKRREVYFISSTEQQLSDETADKAVQTIQLGLNLWNIYDIDDLSCAFFRPFLIWIRKS